MTNTCYTLHILSQFIISNPKFSCNGSVENISCCEIGIFFVGRHYMFNPSIFRIRICMDNHHSIHGHNNHHSIHDHIRSLHTRIQGQPLLLVRHRQISCQDNVHNIQDENIPNHILNLHIPSHNHNLCIPSHNPNHIRHSRTLHILSHNRHNHKRHTRLLDQL